MTTLFSSKTLVWSATLLGAVAIVMCACVFVLTFYNPLVLAGKIANHNVIGYLEWRDSPTIDHEILKQITNIHEIQNKLACKLESCTFWGEQNALVMREREQIIFELYLYKPDKEGLKNTWNSLADINKQVLIGQTKYSLYWIDDIAVIAPQALTTVAKINTIEDMPWLRESGFSAWNKRLGTGYCALACLSTFDMGLKTPFFPAYLQSTIRYSTYTIYGGAPFHAEYQLFFTEQFHHPLSSKRDYHQVVITSNELAVFTGEDFSSKLRMLEGTSQNSGLWQTVESLWSTSATGQAWWQLLSQVGDYPYTFYFGNALEQMRLELTIPEDEKGEWREKMQAAVQDFAAVLFPKKIPLKLPDGTQGFEYIKNNDLLAEWKQEGDNRIFVIGNKLKIYVTETHDHISLGLASPLRLSESTSACFRTTTAVEELQALHKPNWPFIIWTTLRQSSTQKVTGDVYFDTGNNKC